MPMVIAAHAAMGSVRHMDVGMQKQGPKLCRRQKRQALPVSQFKTGEAVAG